MDLEVMRNGSGGDTLLKRKQMLMIIVVKCNLFGPLHQALLMNCTHPLEQFSYRSHCSFRCDKGFTITGPVNLQCLSSGQWTAEVPLCAVEQCQSIQPPARGMMDCVNPIGYYSYNSTCNFACKVGFELSDSQPLICRASGQWTSPVPTCQAIQCQSLEASAHGNTTCVHPHGEFQYQSSCTFLCTKGFQLLGKEVTECTASGKWTAPAPVCQAVQCQPLNIPVHGNFSCIHIHGEFHYQSSCDFKCQEGFLINGAGTTICEASGIWSAPEPICQVIECPNLDAPQNGELNCSHPHGSFAYNSSCAFSCDMGFVRIGTHQLQCTDLGKWTAATPSCEAIQCPPLKNPENGKENCSNPYGHFAYYSSCMFSCNSGFELAGSEKLNCTDQGNWTGDTPICEALKCPELQAPKNGQLKCSQSYGNFTYNSSCIFSCDMGFKKIGSKRLNCTATGEWTGFAPNGEYEKELLPSLGPLQLQLRMSLLLHGGLHSQWNK
ncbi:hypothetical protein Chor_003313 [Crotalus horridus]